MTARRRALVPAIVALAMGAAGACSEVGTDPSAPVAIAFDTLPSLAVVEGDTLRDSLGMAAPITATAFNAAGDTIHGAPFTFIVRDTSTALVVQPSGAFVVADSGSARSTDVTLQASLGSLQFTRTLAIVLSPDTLAAPETAIAPKPVFAPDTATSRKKNLSSPFSVRVLHDSGTKFSPVRLWRVDFVVERDSINKLRLDSARLVDVNGAFIRSSNTGSDGSATAYLRLYPKNGLAAGLSPLDSVIVRASAIYKAGTPIHGAPVRIVVPYRVCTGPTTGCATSAAVVRP